MYILPALPVPFGKSPYSPTSSFTCTASVSATSPHPKRFVAVVTRVVIVDHVALVVVFTQTLIGVCGKKKV